VGGAVVDNLKMTEISLTKNIIIQYFVWYFLDQPLRILKGWKDLLLFNLNFFSIPILLKSFFSPWRKYQVSYGRGFDAARYFEAFVSNLIFRVLGMIMKSVLIISWFFIEIIILFVGAICFVFWLIIPFLLILGLFFSFKSLFL